MTNTRPTPVIPAHAGTSTYAKTPEQAREDEYAPNPRHPGARRDLHPAPRSQSKPGMTNTRPTPVIPAHTGTSTLRQDPRASPE